MRNLPSGRDSFARDETPRARATGPAVRSLHVDTYGSGHRARDGQFRLVALEHDYRKRLKRVRTQPEEGDAFEVTDPAGSHAFGHHMAEASAKPMPERIAPGS